VPPTSTATPGAAISVVSSEQRSPRQTIVALPSAGLGAIQNPDGRTIIVLLILVAVMGGVSLRLGFIRRSPKR